MSKRNGFRKGVLIVTALTCCTFIFGCKDKQAASGAPKGGPVEVAVVTVSPQRHVMTAELAGRTSAYLIAEVRPQVSGIIQKRLFKEGSDVKAGEVLYQIDPATYQATYTSAKAALGKVEASLLTTRAKASRYKELLPTRAISQQDYEDVAGLTRQLEAEIEAAKAAIESARINLDYTRVTAPISGRVGKSSVTTGALVTANQAASLCTIQQFDPIYVDMTQSSGDVLRLKQGISGGRSRENGSKDTKVRLIMENGAPYPLEGSLKFSDVTVDQSTGSITLRAVFPNPDLLLLPGLYVRAVLDQAVDEQAILVPQKGVTRNPKGDAFVMIAGNDDKVEQRAVKTAEVVGEKLRISEGLSAGDRLIVDGLQKVRPGSPVTVVAAGPSEAAGGAPSAGSAQ